MTHPPPPGGPDPHRDHAGFGSAHEEPLTNVPMSGGAPQPPPAWYPRPAYAAPAYPPPIPAPTYAPPPEPGERPKPATLGAMSLVVNGVLCMFMALMSVVFYNQVTERIEAARQARAEEYGYTYVSSRGTGFPLFTSMLNFIWVLAFVALALLALRGFNWARISSFVLNGVSIAWTLFIMLCYGFWYTTMSASRYSASSTEVMPGWYLPGTVIVGVLSVAVAVAGLVLLANRESGDWFRAHAKARAAGVV